MLNKSILMGRLTADAETKIFDEKKRVSNFTMAVDRDYLNNDNSRPADFIQIVAWNLPEKFISKYLKKGELVSVEGRLQSRKYEKGEIHYITEVYADNVYPTSFKKNESGIPITSE
ncbi:MAG: single-stranded DNA-binding protein [Clostridiaceae bacterium]|nr:single-stranded DNA-binding protein [Clostridiaceae bacterium]